MTSYIDSIPTNCFTGSRTGLEKEGLRILTNGQLTISNHPEAFGSALTHQSITTDFCESQLELVTPPCWSSSNALSNLHKLQTFVHKQLPKDELIWNASMPGVISNEDDIRIAEYGSTKSGMMKTVYRRGLAHRYGKKMQLISGIHFNYSFADEIWPALHELEKSNKELLTFTSERYMSTIRNIQRYDWLLLYLFGASPALSSSFCNKDNGLMTFDKSTYYNQYATSLRMSDIGYTNKWQPHNQSFISYHSLDAYLNSLTRAINTPNLEYQRIGFYKKGERIQLNTNELQIENEYYSSVRPKQIPHNGESYLDALRHRGVRYLEIRSIDINPFSSTGLDLQQLQFTELFVNYCLLKDSNPHNRHNEEMNRSNMNKTAHHGRDPGLKLSRENDKIALRDWAEKLLDEMQPIAAKLDTTHRDDAYCQAIDHYRQMFTQPELTPSAKILNEMRENKESYTDFVMRKSHEHHQYHLKIAMSEEALEFHQALTRQSFRQLESLEQTVEKKVQSYT
jgi:glutamate--cysteine ligase